MQKILMKLMADPMINKLIAQMIKSIPKMEFGNTTACESTGSKISSPLE